jgi:hypothetical protein
VTALRPELLEDEQLKQVADIRSNALAARMGKEDLRDGWDKVKRHPNATVQITFEEARAGLQKWLGVEPDTPRPKPAPGPGYSM